MYLIFWEFRTSSARRGRFLRAYGPRGAWAKLFARAPGFVAVGLLRDPQDPLRFFTIDIWKSRAAHRAALGKLRAEYQALDRLYMELTTGERRIGDFEI